MIYYRDYVAMERAKEIVDEKLEIFNRAIIELQQKASENTRCVLVAGGNNSTGVACYKTGGGK